MLLKKSGVKGQGKNNHSDKDNSLKKHIKLENAFDQVERIGRTIGNKIDSDLNLRANQRYVKSKYNLQCADHICVPRYRPTPYTHHGLYLGLGLVIHYDFSRICIVTLEEFSKGNPIFIVQSKLTYSREEAMARAVSRLGEEKYNLITNNCEHFVRWCRSGKEIDFY